jgi:hypothetical protein
VTLGADGAPRSVKAYLEGARATLRLDRRHSADCGRDVVLADGALVWRWSGGAGGLSPGSAGLLNVEVTDYHTSAAALSRQLKVPTDRTTGILKSRSPTITSGTFPRLL